MGGSLSKYTIHHGDCLDVLRSLPDCSVDACVTDPPYGLRFMGKSWDCDVPRAETWAEVLRVLKPGAHLLSFFGTRTYHRGVVQIEDAGFEIRDCIAWVYGQGFPKSHNLGDGRGTALKPAMEPIVVARKPLGGAVAANVERHGTGALNIDACRIPTDEDRSRPNSGRKGHGNGTTYGHSDAYTNESHVAGRWPANLILDEGAAAVLDEQSGVRRSSGFFDAKDHHKVGDSPGGVTTFMKPGVPATMYADSGGASRFFYCAKANKKDRGEGNRHPTVKPHDLMRYLCRLVTPPGGAVLDPFAGSGSTGKAAIAEGLSFIGIERELEYVEIARARLAATAGHV